MTGITLDQLREQVRGDVVAPGDEGYDEARKVYNAMIDRRPTVVARCSNVGDVVAAVNFARENGLDLAVHQALAQGGTVLAVQHHQDLDPVEGIGAVLRY